MPGGGAEQVVARLDADSEVQQGQEVELWLDADRLHFFDPETGRSLTGDVSDSRSSPRTRSIDLLAPLVRAQ